MTPEELIAELKASNDLYHKNFNAIMCSVDIDAAVKAKTGSYMNNIFQLMNEVNNWLNSSIVKEE
jgi:hypothetical protein